MELDALQIGDGSVGFGAEIRHRLPPLHALTSLRFLAAIYVVIYHLSADHIYSGMPVLGTFIRAGHTGVSLFFVLSGFILAYNYNDVPDKRDFWISRFARIYPVYLFALLLSVMFAFAPASPRTDHCWLRLGLTASLLQSWYEPFAQSFNGPGWTLSVETFFYALFPFLLKRIRQVGDRAAMAFCAVYAAVLSVPVWMNLVWPGNRTSLTSAHYLTWGDLPPLHLPMFLLGVYLGMRYLKQATQWSWLPLLLGVAGSVALLSSGPGPLYAPLRTGLLVVTYAALIYGLASVKRGWLTNRWMVRAGEISYSIYLLQMPVMRAVLAVARRVGLGFYLSSAVVLLVLTATSFLAYRFIELPARVAIRSRLTRRPVSLIDI